MPTFGQISLLIVSIAFFAVGGGISLARLWSRRPGLRIAAKACLYGGLTAGMAVLVWHSAGRGSWLPLEDNFDALIWLGLLLTLFVLYVQRSRPLGGLDWFIMPIVILLLAAAAVFGKTNWHSYSVADLWSWVHRVTAYGGTAAFAVAGAVGAMYLITNRRLRSKSAAMGPNLGSLERLEHLTLISVTLGFALLTVGAVTGFVQMIFEHKQTPLPKIVLTAGVWLVYALVLHSPINPSFRGRRAAMLSIIGFILMIGTIIAVQFMPEGAG